MAAALPTLEDLPRQSASQVKNKWGDVARRVRESGSVAITNHNVVEMVLLDAAKYRQLTEEIHALRSREQFAMGELAERFRARLAVLQQPNADRKVRSVLESRGKLAKRPKAGTTF